MRNLRKSPAQNQPYLCVPPTYKVYESFASAEGASGRKIEHL